MSLTRTMDVAAHDRKRGMTLAEMEWLIQRAKEAGATGSEVLMVTTVGWPTVRVKTVKVQMVAAERDDR